MNNMIGDRCAGKKPYIYVWYGDLPADGGLIDVGMNTGMMPYVGWGKR